MKYLHIRTRTSSAIREIACDDPRVGPWFSYQTVYDHQWQAEAAHRFYLKKIS